MSVKSGDKYLQLGQEKCKAMVVGRKVESFHIPRLEVDTWETQHDNEGKLIESFGCKKTMEIINELTNLGVKICSDGKNMKNIIH